MDELGDGSAVDLLTAIEDLIAMVEGARKVPLTGRAMINQDEVLGILEQLRDALPDEVAQARWVLREKDKLISQARSEAERMVRDAAAKAEELAKESAIAEAARKHAEGILEQARQVSREIRLSANEYTDGLLVKVQEVLREGARLVDSARTELRGQAAAARVSGPRSPEAGKAQPGEGKADPRGGERSSPLSGGLPE